MRDFNRAEIEQLTTGELLIALPEGWQLWQDSGWWHLTDIDESAEFEHRLAAEPSPRRFLIEFLLWYQGLGLDLHGMLDVAILAGAKQRALSDATPNL